MREPHIDEHGAARMVEVGGKPEQHRVAVARARVTLGEQAMQALAAGHLAKGDALAVVRIAAIQAAKRTADLIPLCHPVAIDRVQAEVVLEVTARTVTITTTVASTGRTGVEMEALTAAAAGALALYDMVKGQEGPAPVIERVELVEKTVDGERRGPAPA